MGNRPLTSDWEEIKSYYSCDKIYLSSDNIPTAKLTCPICKNSFKKAVSYLRFKIKSMPYKEQMCCSNNCTQKDRAVKLKARVEDHADKELPFIGASITSAKTSLFDKGRAGEYLVMSHFLGLGYDAFLTNPKSPYDIVLDYKNKLYKVQVKSCLKPMPCGNSPLQYMFQLSSPKYKHYSRDNIDLLALVGLDIAAIAYVPFLTEKAKSFVMTPPNWCTSKGTPINSNIDKYPLDEAITTLEEFKKNGKVSKINKNYFFGNKGGED